MILTVYREGSFVHNLLHAMGEDGSPVTIRRVDETGVDEIAAIRPSALVLLGGAGLPREPERRLVEAYSGKLPILGVGSGLLALVEACGGRLRQAPRPRIGKPCLIRHRGDALFQGIPTSFTGGLYLSRVVAPESLPESLEVTAVSDQGDVMAVRHGEWPLFGVLFHPESILTEGGSTLLANYRRMVEGAA